MLGYERAGDMVGAARAVGDALRRAAADRGLCARVAVATTRMAALLAVQGRAGLTVIPPGLEGRSTGLAPVGRAESPGRDTSEWGEEGGSGEGASAFPDLPHGLYSPHPPSLGPPRLCPCCRPCGGGV